MKLFLFLIVTAIFSGCTSAKPKISTSLETSFQELLPIKDMNKSFQIYVDSSDQDNLKFGNDIKLAFKNITGQDVFFPVGYGIRLFVIRNNEWMEIQNYDDYYGEGSWLQTINQQTSGGRLVTWVSPVLPPEIADGDHQVILRTVIIGELVIDSKKTGIPVGAYTDVYLQP
jgi:hypothetical protein